MKTFAAVFAAIFLMVGCITGPGPSVQTPTTHLPTLTAAVPVAPTDTPTVPLLDDYPPAITPPFILTATAQPYPPPDENRYTFGPTPTRPSPLQEAQSAWDSCRNSEIPPEMVTYQDIALAGLVFRYDNNKWQIDADGRPALTSCLNSSWTSPGGGWKVFWWNEAIWVVDRETGVLQPIASSQERYSAYPVWSPDEKYVYYVEATSQYEEADIWVWEKETGKSHPLTQTPQVHEYPVSIWPAHPDWLLFISRPRDLLNEPEAVGYLTLMKTDGSGEQRLSESLDTSFAFSPDGTTLAYTSEQKPMLLSQPGSPPKEFLYRLYSLPDWEIHWLSRPNWSPDGKKIVWSASASNKEGDFTGAAVFDLAAGRAWFVHPFVHIGMGWSAFSPRFDPTGEWIASYIPDEKVEQLGVWVIRYDGSEEHFLQPSTSEIHWNPEGDEILYRDPDAMKIYRLLVREWALMETNLPYDVVPLKWLESSAP